MLILGENVECGKIKSGSPGLKAISSELNDRQGFSLL